jgi:hypothetical protein
VPCSSPTGAAYIDTFKRIVEVGERRYFFACDFPSSPASAAVALSDGVSQTLDLLHALPNPDLQIGSAQEVAEWLALPIYATGIYTLTVIDTSGNQAALPFRVDPPSRERILTVPEAGPPGTTFQVYYIYFDLRTSQMFEFYGEDEASATPLHHLSHRASWQIAIDQALGGGGSKGWAQAALPSASTDDRKAYAISYNNNAAYVLFWLR